MNRRELLRLGLAAVPASAWAQHHPDVPAAVAPADVSSGAEWKPAFLDAHQNATAIVLSELIIPQTDTPGAKAALVNRYMDKLLAASPPARQAPLTSGLEWLDQYAKKTSGKTFVDLTAPQQTAILEKLSTASNSGDLATGHRFFQTFKSFTASIYYATEIGFAELNKGGRVPKIGTSCAA